MQSNDRNHCTILESFCKLIAFYLNWRVRILFCVGCFKSRSAVDHDVVIFYSSRKDEQDEQGHIFNVLHLRVSGQSRTSALHSLELQRTPSKNEVGTGGQ